MRTAILAVFVSVLLLHNASAQAPLGSGAASPGPAAMPSGPSAGPSKAAACRDAARGSGVRGPDMQDEVQVCVAEAHIDCLKQAVAQKIRGPQRQEFIKSCMGK